MEIINEIFFEAMMIIPPKVLRKKLNNPLALNENAKYEKNQLSFVNDEIINDVIKNHDKKPYLRKYSEKFIVFCQIAYIFGAKCYNFIRSRIPLCSISYIKKLSKPILCKYIKTLFTIEDIINLVEVHKLSGLHASIAIDAAAFQKIQGSVLLERFPLLQTIDSLKIDKEKIYSNVFVFLLQPFSIYQQTIPIQIMINENGNANINVILLVKDIIKYLNMFNIIIDFVCTDGDRFYDLEHYLFFYDYINRVYNFQTFDYIYNMYVIQNVLLPNSDILHLLKCVRRNLLKKDFIFIDYYNNITISINEFEEYDLNKVIDDCSSQGSMKDSYPLILFSFHVFSIMCKKGNFKHAFYL